MSAGRALPVKAPAQKEPASVGSQRARKRADDGEIGWHDCTFGGTGNGNGSSVFAGDLPLVQRRTDEKFIAEGCFQ